MRRQMWPLFFACLLATLLVGLAAGRGLAQEVKAVPLESVAPNSTPTPQVNNEEATPMATPVTSSLDIRSSNEVSATIKLIPQGFLGITGQTILFPDTLLTGSAITVDALAAPWSAVDTTFTGAGWHATLSAGDFMDGAGHILPVSRFKVRIKNNEIQPVGSNESPRPISQVTAFTVLNPTGAQILTANVKEGMGEFRFVPHFRLLVPGNLTLGDGMFSTVVTATMIVGP